MKCTKGHTSFNGCEKCDTVAEKSDSTTVYLVVGEKRTDDSFRSFEDVQHHHANRVSPLIGIKPKINMVKQFILDPILLLSLGVMLRLLEMRMGGDLSVKLSANQKK